MLRALLVGIDTYPVGTASLHGCVADVDAVERLLTASGTTTSESVRVLRDEEATRQAVIDAFREHLGAAGPDDVAVFWYCGHGSRQPSADPGEIDGKDETLVLVDSRTPGGRDLVDTELGALVAEVAHGGAHVAVVLDCCHSGSGTRDLDEAAGVRQAQPREDAPPVGLDGTHLASPSAPHPDGSSASTGSGWHAPRGRHVLLAACRADQTAKERTVAGSRRGVFTAALELALSTAREGVTYDDLVRSAAATVRDWAEQQDPQLEATDDRDARARVLSGALDDRPRHHLVTHEAAGWTLDAGLIHQVPVPTTAGTTVLDVFPPGTDPGTTAPVAVARVVSVGPASSIVSLEPTLDESRSYPAIVTAWPAPRTLVRTSDATDVTEGLAGSLDLVVGEPAQLTIERQDTGYRVTDLSRTTTAPAASVTRAVDLATHMSRWHRLRSLDNPGTRIDVGSVRLELTVRGPHDERQVPARGEVLMPYVGDQPQEFVLRVTNGTPSRLYGAILGLTESYAIDGSPTPGHVATAIDPGRTLASFGGQPVPEIVPDELWHAGHSRRSDDVVVLLSTAPFDLASLTQPPLDFSSTRTDAERLADAAHGEAFHGLVSTVRDREWGRPTHAPVADWAVLRFALVAERPLAGRTVGPVAAELVPGVLVEPHPLLRADASLSSQGFATRDGDRSVTPPGLRDDPESVRPFSFVTDRDGAEPVDVLTLTKVVRPESVSPEQPLLLTLDGPPQEDSLLVVGMFGDVYLPVGWGQGNRLVVSHLPPEEPVRSLGSAIRLLVTRIVRRATRRSATVVRLALATTDGDRIPRTDDRGEIRRALAARPDGQVLVLVHGIIGDTRGMAEAFLRPPGGRSMREPAYDVVLTFDYENLDTPIPETAAALRGALLDVGLGTGTHAITVVAHSMGGLVSRWMVEVLGPTTPAGEPTVAVHRLVTAGAPAGGSPWSTIEDLAIVGITFALNRVGPAFWPAQVLSLLVGALEKADTALDQMKPGSDVLDALFTAGDPHVPCTALVGNTSLIARRQPDGWAAVVVARLKDLLGHAVDLAFLGQEHDIAVATTSGAHVPPGRVPAVQVVPVACNHFGYFATPAGVDALRAALTDGAPTAARAHDPTVPEGVATSDRRSADRS